MTTLREAAQHVVEVWKLYGTAESLRGWMEILEAALAEPENWELRRLHAELERCKQVCAATSEAWREEAALAEDVATHGSAWSKNGKRIDPMSVYAEPVKPVAYSIGRTLHWHEGKGVNDAQLYLAPPQRKPLTEEEIDSIWDSEKAFADIYAIARAIERAHGIGDSDE